MFTSAPQRRGPAVKTAPGQAHKDSIARAQIARREAAACAEGYSLGPIRKAPAAPSYSGVWAAANPLTMLWRTGPAATRIKPKPTMRRWNKRSSRGGWPLNAVFNVWEELP